jgi:hypothetical protein
MKAYKKVSSKKLNAGQGIGSRKASKQTAKANNKTG